MSHHRAFAAIVFLGFMGAAALTAQDSGQKSVLLSVSAGQVPPDTGLDGKTKPEIVTDVKELGEKALKVAFAPGDSFGSRGGGDSNWKRFAFFRLDAVNPAAKTAELELVVVHRRSSSYQTRVVVPIKLKPGKNEVRIGMDEMTNVNGSAPDLAHVTKWYLADSGSKGPTLYFGDIYLDGGDTPSSKPSSAPGPQSLIGYHVKGKVGNLSVELTVSPFLVGGAGAAPQGVKGDPARLARIRSAKMPKFDKPILFNTPEADAIVSALEVFPPDNPWNLDVSTWPLHPNSRRIVASIGPGKPLRYNPDMGYVLVPPDQQKIDLKNVEYAAESDKGPFPVPDNTPIEGWPASYTQNGKKVTLDDVQRDRLKENGDRHALAVDPVNRMLYEFYQLKKTDAGWQAAQSSIFDLKTNKMRPEEWTSSDAAGLPVFPAVVRYDELKRGMVEHAMRVTVVKTRRAYVYPARHYASRLTDESLPRMGERLRLRADFDVSGFSPPVQAILKGLKKYGMLVADNGIDWAISVAPDERIPALHDELRKVKGSDFEVVQAPPGYRPPD